MACTRFFLPFLCYPFFAGWKLFSSLEIAFVQVLRQCNKRRKFILRPLCSNFFLVHWLNLWGRYYARLHIHSLSSPFVFIVRYQCGRMTFDTCQPLHHPRRRRVYGSSRDRWSTCITHTTATINNRVAVHNHKNIHIHTYLYTWCLPLSSPLLINTFLQLVNTAPHQTASILRCMQTSIRSVHVLFACILTCAPFQPANKYTNTH